MSLDLALLQEKAPEIASGALITGRGWAWLNMASVLPLLLVALALVWLAWKRPRATSATLP